MISIISKIQPIWASLDITSKVIVLVISAIVVLSCSSIVKNIIKAAQRVILKFLDKLSVFFKKLRKVEIKGGGIIFDAGSDVNPASNEYSSHKDCQKYSEVVKMFQERKELDREVRKLYRQISKIEEVIILKEQMKHAEYLIEEMVVMAETTFSRILKLNNADDDIFASKEYRIYKGVLELIREKLIIKIRLMCRDNHFAEKTEAEFAAYIKMQDRLIQSFIREKVVFYFPYYSELTDYDMMDEVYAGISTAIFSFFHTAREISKAKRAEICELENEIDALEIEFDKKYQIIGI